MTAMCYAGTLSPGSDFLSDGAAMAMARDALAAARADFRRLACESPGSRGRLPMTRPDAGKLTRGSGATGGGATGGGAVGGEIAIEPADPETALPVDGGFVQRDMERERRGNAEHEFAGGGGEIVEAVVERDQQGAVGPESEAADALRAAVGFSGRPHPAAN